jgi:hypothetical protein
MSDTIGRITVPDVTPSGTFPLKPDYGYGVAQQRKVITHTFGSANAKIEQRFYVGTSARRFLFRRASLNETARRLLRDFWQTQKGPDGAFTYNAPAPGGASTEAVTVRFEIAPLTFEHLSDTMCSVGLTFVEVVNPADAPTYSVSSTCTRFPSLALNTALLSQVQEIIPLVHITVREEGVPEIYLSDRRCTVDGQLYLPRLLRIGEEGGDALITQTLDGAPDDVRFVFGNSDRVMAEVSRDTDLRDARIDLSLYHVGSAIKLDLWSGQIADWQIDDGPEFPVTAQDWLRNDSLMVPEARITRTCRKPFNTAAAGCPYATQGSGGDPDVCDHSYDGDNGCVAHGMKRYFGGVRAEVQGVLIKDNSSGTFGIGRRLMNATSQVADSIYGDALPAIWHDDDGKPNLGLPVNAKLAAGRPEGDFYDALGIVGEGPLSAYTEPQMYEQADGAKIMLAHTVDGSPHHGFRTDGTGNDFGLRTVRGTDPAGDHDYFSLGRVGTSAGSGEVADGGSVYRDVFAAGAAFAEIRISVPKGSPPSSITEHAMKVFVSGGLSGYTWDAPGSRTLAPRVTNPVWVAVNTYLRGMGLRSATAAEQEAYFDIEAAIATADICDTVVDKLVGTGTERQYRFRGVLADPKPLRDWLREILNTCLGYFTWSAGKLKIGLRYSAEAPHALTIGNVLLGSLRVAPIKPQFERLIVEYADEEYGFQRNQSEYRDDDHAARRGRRINPLTSTLALVGCSSKSLGARIATIRTREEVGGVTESEQRAAAEVSLRTTILALEVDAGSVCSCSTGLPDYQGKFRVTSWRLNRDWSIDLAGRSVTDSMYDVTTGPKAVDAPAAPIPVEPARDWNPPPEPSFGVAVSSLDPTVAEVSGLTFPDGPDNTHTVESGSFSFWYVDEAAVCPTLAAGIDADDTSMTLDSASGVGNSEYYLIGAEIVGTTGDPTGDVVPIALRSQLGSTAASHLTGVAVRKLIQRVVTVAWPKYFWDSADAAGWKLDVSLPDTKLVAVVATVRNDYGEGPAGIVCTTGTTDQGLRLQSPSAGSGALTMIAVVNTDRSLSASDGDQVVTVTTTTRGCTITLPPESGMIGRTVTVKRAAGSTYDVIVAPGASDTIEGSGSSVTMSEDSESRTWTGQ